jgi:hypothetical protein
MERKKTTPEQRALLAKNGYFRADGLPLEAEGGIRFGEELRAVHLGTGGFTPGTEIIITHGGEIWLRATGIGKPADWDEIIKQLEVRHAGDGAKEDYRYILGYTVILLRLKDVLGRIADPSYVAQR